METDIQVVQSSEPAGRRRIWLGALVLLILAAATRFIGLGSQNMWGDEVYSYIASKDLITKLLRWDTQANQAHSPLPFIEMKVGRALFGNTEFGNRFVVACYGTLAVLLLYVLLGRRLSWLAGFMAALMLALNPFALEWSREARMYSNWLAYALLTLIVVEEAVRFTLRRSAQGDWSSVLNWRWWLTGILLMLMHASTVHSVTTVAGTGACLALIGLFLLGTRWRAGVMVLAGSALSGLVFLSSWSLTGIGKLLHYIHHPGSSGVVTHPRPLLANLDSVLTMVAGYLPTGWAIALWAAALAGIVLVFTRRRWVLGLLLIMLLLSPWITYPVFSKELWWTGRYTFVAIITLSAGLGVVAAALWTARNMRLRALGRVVVLLGLAGMCLLWLPAWRAVFTQPKMQFKEALAPLYRKGHAGEAVIIVPDWYMSMTAYYPLPGELRPLIPPPQAIYDKFNFRRLVDPWPQPYVGDFVQAFKENPAQGKPIPPATWLVLIDPLIKENLPSDPAGSKPIDRIHRVLPVLAAYGVADPQHVAELEHAAAGPNVLTLTVCVRPYELDDLSTTTARAEKYR